MTEKFIKRYLEFLKSSPTPFHATKKCEEILQKNMFKRMDKFVLQDILPGKYYIKHNKTFLIAFTIPKSIKTKKSIPFKIVATHSDSPVLKIKPNGISSDANLLRLQPYGGGLWHTWFDRPLGVAGQLVYKDLTNKLIYIRKPIAYIPSLAIHLDRLDVYKDGFRYNKEDHLRAIIGNIDVNGCILKNNFFEKSQEILSYDLSLFDIQDPIIGGLDGKLIFSARQDNLLSTFCAIEAILVESDIEENINIVLVFDHEEIGSETISGAETQLFRDFLLIFEKIIDKEDSLLISADVAHGFNPNYPAKYDEKNRPELGKGIVIKNSIRYATNSYTSAVIKYLMDDLPTQEFALRNDSLGGSTIGPMLVAGTGIKGVDIGAPILGMHSIKEVSHSDDLMACYTLFKRFYARSLTSKSFAK